MPDWTRAGLQILPFDAHSGASHFGLDTPSGASHSSVQIKWTRRRTDHVSGHRFRCRRHARPSTPRALLDPDGWPVRIDFRHLTYGNDAKRPRAGSVLRVAAAP